jgi:hypothetical protein
MAEKRTIEVEIQDNVKSLKSQYREALAELQKVTEQYGATSEEAVKAAKAAAELKDQIEDSKNLVDAFNPDAKFNALTGSIGGALNAFQAYEGALGLIGVESENLQKTMVRVQSAMALSQGLQGIMEAKDQFKNLGTVLSQTAVGQGLLTAATAAYRFVQTGSFKTTKENIVAKQTETVATKAQTTAQTGLTTATSLGSVALKTFRAALISTGIGAIIALVGYLIGNLDKLGEAFSWVGNKIAEFTDWIGITDGASEQMSENDKKRVNAQIENIDREIEKTRERAAAREASYSSEDQAFNRQISLAKAQGKNTTDLERARIKASIQYRKDMVKENEAILKQTQLQLTLFASTLRKDEKGVLWGSTEEIKRLNDLNKALTTANQDLKKSQDDLLNANNDLAVFDAQVEKQKQDDAKAEAQRQKEKREQSTKTTTTITTNNNKVVKDTKAANKEIIDDINKKADEQNKLNKESQNQKLALLDEGIEKEKQARNNAFVEFRDNFLKEQNKAEREALDKKFIDGKISRTKYEEELKNLQLNYAKNLTAEEAAILKTAEEVLQKDLNAIDAKYKEIELNAINEANKNRLAKEQEFQSTIEGIDEQNFQKRTEKQLGAKGYELELVRQKYFELENLAKGNAEQEAIIAEAKESEINEIKKRYDEEDKARKRAELERNVGFAKQGLTIIADLTDLFNKKGTESAKKAFKIKKSAQMANALIDTYMNATAAYGSQFMPVPDPSSPVRGGIAAGLAVAAGLANVAKIASQKFEGGSASGGGGVNGGGGGLGGATQAPTFNVIGNNGLNQLAQLQQQPTQAFVVSGHVTTAQSLDRNRIENATL